jgi:hypothetical protein
VRKGQRNRELIIAGRPQEGRLDLFLVRSEEETITTSSVWAITSNHLCTCDIYVHAKRTPTQTNGSQEQFPATTSRAVFSVLFRQKSFYAKMVLKLIVIVRGT